MLIYNCSRDAVVVGTGVFQTEDSGDGVWPERSGKSGEVAFLDERFYVIEVLGQGQAGAGFLKRASYALEAEGLGKRVIVKGDRLALVLGW